MASKLIKGNINLKLTLENSQVGDVIYLEAEDLTKFNDVMKQVSSYASRAKIKVKQTAFKGLSNNDQLIKISKVEIISK
ncbi:hypothetical protein NVP1187O_236 [Vibrio phage 1.187.O._10N.286.49.F1]|nr:hypothetical protein NVP1187O_236 [Vibrio phage 1.187.O._10N.286.49.F1]